MNKPFLLRPAAKDYLWGGSRLNDEFAKNIEASPLAETWECSTHPDGLSTVASGEHEGGYLRDVLRAHPGYLGTHPMTIHEPCAIGELPILIKLIDAKQNLSVQVHPTDEYAKEHDRDASLIYGFRRNVGKEELRRAIQSGKVERYLQRIPVRADDLFFIEAGTVHAIGAGTLVAEIQESSNLTYRLYDYDRVDKDGRKRALHIEKALDVANLQAFGEPRQPLRVLRYSQGMARELLGRCKYFEVHRMLVNTERRQIVNYKADGMSFRVLLCIEGCGMVCAAEEILEVYKGDCLFVPADSVEMRIHGKLQFLEVRS